MNSVYEKEKNVDTVYRAVGREDKMLKSADRRCIQKLVHTYISRVIKNKSVLCSTFEH